MKTAEYRGDIAPDGAVQPFRVSVRDGVNKEAVTMLQQTPHMQITDPDDPTAQGMLIRSKTKLQKPAEFDAFPQLQTVARVGVGVDNINMTLASERGLATVNTPGASTLAVGQRVEAFSHAWAARIFPGTQSLREGHWYKDPQDLRAHDIQPISLRSKKLGIVGYGRIGQEVRRRLEPVMGGILFYDVRDIDGKMELEPLLEQADIVSVNASFAATNGGNGEILTAENLPLVRPGSLIVNTARGGVINHPGLLERMDAGVYAALDVFPQENPGMFQDPVIARIVQHPRFMGTPHTAASDDDTQRELAKEGATRVREYAREGTINPLDISGHTLPRVALNENPTPGTRGVFLHPSVKGSLAAITQSAASHGVNIHGLANGEGEYGLAATIAHLDTQDPEIALAIQRTIAENIQLLHARLLQFS